MAETRPILLAFNRGIVSPLAVARVDLKRMAMSAEEQTNWMPRVLGAMSLRPGTRFLHSTKGDAAAAHLEFVFAVDDTALIELTAGFMRVVIDDEVLTRPSVASAVTNGTFDTDVAGWTDNDQVGATSAWATGGYLSLLGNGTTFAIRDQQVTVAAPDQNVQHGLAIHIAAGTATLRVGSSSGAEDYVAATTLRTGRHSIAFTPTGNFHIRLSARDDTATLVSSITVEAAGPVTLVSPWGAADLQNVRYDQSGDVLFCACKAHRQRRIERQDAESWSIVEYLAEDGPFRAQNLGPTTLQAGALSGSTTLTASAALFRATNVGSLFRLSSAGQTVRATITAADTFTDPIKVTGIGSTRVFNILTSGTWGATLTLQRSVGEPGAWTTVAAYTTNQSLSSNDGLDNQVIYYRIGVKAGEFTSGSITAELIYAFGTSDGTALVTGYTSATQVSIDVLEAFGSTAATANWREGSWSDRRGWPSAVALHDGRLWWAGKDKIAGSVSDAFNSFDDTVSGDSGPITRSIGAGPVDTINWLLPLPSLLVGTQGAELVAKASSLDEPLTPTAFSLKPASSLGSAALRAIKIDTGGVYVQRSGSRVYELALDGSTYNYTSNDLTAIVPELGLGGFVRIAVQRQPDTRIHCVRADGSVAILVFDRLEKVTCWVLYETDGAVEDVVVLPGSVEDAVYYTVRRTINGSTKRYTEKWALESEAQGAQTTILTDATLTYSGASTTTITGLTHLEGETVVVWGNTKDLGSYTVTGGGITLSEAVTLAYIGLPYTADFRSAKLSTASEVPLSQRQQLHHLGLLLANAHAQGLRYGQDFDNLDGMPLIDDEGGEVDADKIWTSYNADSTEVDGRWHNDARLCLRAASPRPCTVLAAVLSVTGHVK